MSNVIESLAIEIGLESEGLREALDDVGQRLNTLKGRLVTVAESMTGVETSSQKAGKEASAGFDKIALSTKGATHTLDGFRTGLTRLLVPLTSALATGKLFSDFLNQGEALDDVSKRLGVNAKQLDAWSKAARDAGGSEAGFKSALESFMQTTGQSADAFYSLGKRIDGMSTFAAKRTLDALGVTGDAQQVFLKFRGNAEAIAKSYESIAMDAKQAETAKAFNLAWRSVSDTFSSVAQQIFTMVTPALTGMLRLVRSVLGFLNEHTAIVKTGFTALSVFLAGQWLGTMVKVIGSFSGLLSLVKNATIAVRAFGVALMANPLGLVIAAVIALAVAIEDLFTFAEGGVSVFETLLETMGMAPETISKVREAFKTGFDAIGVVLDKVSNAFKATFDFVKSIVNLLFGDGTWGDVGNQLAKTLDAQFMGLPSFLGDLLQKPFDSAVGYIKDKIDSLKGMLSSAGSSVARFFGFGDEEDSNTVAKPNGRVLGGAQGRIAASVANTQTSNVIDQRKTITVETNITTNSDPEAVSGAVYRGVNRAMNPYGDILTNADSGVRQKG